MQLSVALIVQLINFKMGEPVSTKFQQPRINFSGNIGFIIFDVMEIYQSILDFIFVQNILKKTCSHLKVNLLTIFCFLLVCIGTSKIFENYILVAIYFYFILCKQHTLKVFFFILCENKSFFIKCLFAHLSFWPIRSP